MGEKEANAVDKTNLLRWVCLIIMFASIAILLFYSLIIH